MKNNDAQNSHCRFFPSCGGCSYLDLLDDEYQKIKIENLKKDLAEILNDTPSLAGRAFEMNVDRENQAFKVRENILPELDFFSVGPHSRRKIILQLDAKNKLGFFAKGSKDLVAIDACYVAQKEISDLIPALQNIFENFEANVISQVAVTAFDNIVDVVFSCLRELNFSQIQKITAFAKAFKINASYRLKNQVTPIITLQPNQIFYPNFKIDLSSDIFIQATKLGLHKITSIISDFIKNKFDKKIILADIYTGFGAYSFGIVELTKEIYAFEGSEEMTKLIAKNATKNGFNNRIKTEHRDLMLYPVSEREMLKFDLVIINPPRNGAGPQIHKIANSKLQNLIYVSCNPKTFARDAGILLDSGFKITKLTAIDQFYSSPHLEVVGVFERLS